MRRPVKPFVTEYKGSARRGKDGRPEVEEIKAPDRPAGKAPKRPAAQRTAAEGRGADGRGAEGRGSLPPRGLFRAAEDEPINSYEAAMRAADALFSPKSKTDADRTAGERAGPDRSSPSGPASAAAPPPGPAEGTGRVLRALDEPEPALPEPPDEPAPRRRGRKPGSLNKPKVPDAPGAVARGARRRPAEAPPTAPIEPEDAFPEQDDDRAAPPAHAPAEPVLGEPADAGAAPPGPARQRAARERFPWVRTKLRPGEKWKRRLPKVAW